MFYSKVKLTISAALPLILLFFLSFFSSLALSKLLPPPKYYHQPNAQIVITSEGVKILTDDLKKFFDENYFDETSSSGDRVVKKIDNKNINHGNFKDGESKLKTTTTRTTKIIKSSQSSSSSSSSSNLRVNITQIDSFKFGNVTFESNYVIFHVPSIHAKGSWSYEVEALIKIRDKGDAEATFKNGMIKIGLPNFVPTREGKWEVDSTTTDNDSNINNNNTCECSIQIFSMRFKGARAFLYNILKRLFYKLIRKEISESMCQQAKMLFNRYLTNKLLANFQSEYYLKLTDAEDSNFATVIPLIYKPLNINNNNNINQKQHSFWMEKDRNLILKARGQIDENPEAEAEAEQRNGKLFEIVEAISDYNVILSIKKKMPQMVLNDHFPPYILHYILDIDLIQSYFRAIYFKWRSIEGRYKLEDEFTESIMKPWKYRYHHSTLMNNDQNNNPNQSIIMKNISTTTSSGSSSSTTKAPQPYNFDRFQIIIDFLDENPKALFLPSKVVQQVLPSQKRADFLMSLRFEVDVAIYGLEIVDPEACDNNNNMTSFLLSLNTLTLDYSLNITLGKNYTLFFTPIMPSKYEFRKNGESYYYFENQKQFFENDRDLSQYASNVYNFINNKIVNEFLDQAGGNVGLKLIQILPECPGPVQERFEVYNERSLICSLSYYS